MLMPRHREMSLMKNFIAISHHSQATSKSKRIRTFISPSIIWEHQHGYVQESNLHKIDTQPEVQLRVGAFWCLRPHIFGRRYLPI